MWLVNRIIFGTYVTVNKYVTDLTLRESVINFSLLIRLLILGLNRMFILHNLKVSLYLLVL
jgi:NADH:ubiquinone oxidoreductase subunit 4 (subunit M)